MVTVVSIQACKSELLYVAFSQQSVDTAIKSFLVVLKTAVECFCWVCMSLK